MSVKRHTAAWPALVVALVVSCGACTTAHTESTTTSSDEVAAPPTTTSRAGSTAAATSTSAVSSTTLPGGWACPDVDPLIDLGGIASDGEREQLALETLVAECIPDLQRSTYDDSALARAASAGHLSGVEFLLGAGADPHYVDKQGISVLMWASRWVHLTDAEPRTVDTERDRNKAQIVATLVAEGVALDLQDELGFTALMAACVGYFPETMGVLIDAGADPNLASVDGVTPLICAAGGNLIPTAQALLLAGADPTLATAQGTTALSLAQDKGLTEMMSILMEAMDEL